MSSNPLVEKLRRARESKVQAGGYTFIVRRPTDVEAQRLSGVVNVAELIPFVIGWEKVREIDVISSGDPHPLKFDADVCREWLSDRPDLLVPLVDKIVALYQAHRAELGAAEKN